MLAVVIYHFGGGSTSWLPGGFLGVDVFFVLSGYLITSLLLSEHARTGRIALAEFWARRARRLLPALALVLIGATLWVWWASPINDYPRRRADVLWSLGYLANWHLSDSGDNYFAEYGTASPLRHMWSLAVEEQFYLVWPVLVIALLAAGRAVRGRRWFGARIPVWRFGGLRLVVLAAVAGIVVSSVTMAVQWSAEDPTRAYYGTDGRVQELFVGVLLAVVLARRAKLRPAWLATGSRALVVVSVAGLVALVAAMCWLSDVGMAYYRGGALLACLATAGLIAGVERGPDGALARVFSWRPAVALGRISYGVYLWHWPVCVALPVMANWTPEQVRMQQVWRVVLTLALALASYRFVEQPVLRSGWLRRSPLRTGAATVAVAVAVVVAAVRLTSLPGAMYEQVAVSSDSSCSGERVDRLVACARPAPGDATPGGAAVGPHVQRAPVMVAGDSIARGLAAGMDEWAAAAGTHWVQAAWKECSTTGLMAVRTVDAGPSPRVQACHDQARARILEALDRYRPRTVLVTEFTPHYKPLLVDGHKVAPGTPQHAALLRAGYQRLVDDVAARGGRVVFVELAPPGDSVASVVAKDRKAGSTPGTGPGGEYVGAYNAVLRDVAAARPGLVGIVSVTDVLCPRGRCGPIRDGVIMRVDGVHYSREFAQVIAPLLLRRAGVAA